MKKTSRSSITPYTTKDKSTIIELIHPEHHGASLGAKNQSLAEAIVPAGMMTCLHLHRTSEEIYHVISGKAEMVLGNEYFLIEAGDSVCIPPGTPHQVSNTGQVELHILCACSPPYSHQDTEILGD